MAAFLAKRKDIAKRSNEKGRVLVFGDGFESVGKTLMIFGLLLLIAGAVVYFGGKYTALGRLPGDIHIENANFSFHFPVVTSIVVSIVLTVVLNLFFFRH